MSADGLSSTTKIELFAYAFLLSLAGSPNGTVDRSLLNVADTKAPASAIPINGVKTFDHVIDPSRDLWFRTFVPVGTNQTSLPVLLYFHGGGYVSFSPSTVQFDKYLRHYAAHIPAVIISVNYRLAAEHRCPAQFDDGFDAVKYIDANRDRIVGLPETADFSRCFLGGDSAGGNLAHHLLVRMASEPDQFKAVKIRGVVAVQPFFGGEKRTESELRLANYTWLTLNLTDFYWKAFLPVGSNRDHPAANVFGPGSRDLSGLKFPPMLVVVGGKDLLQDWQRSYYYGLKRSGKEVELVEYPNVVHGFFLSTDTLEFFGLVARIKDFFHKQLQMHN